ncbi:MAG: efflux RND transporter periplasmic adaptor subunit [Nitrospirae bacterium]|nr:efflux RND transporter periplasmic adaptor subunit [Nitrospirota bacterium]
MNINKKKGVLIVVMVLVILLLYGHIQTENHAAADSRGVRGQVQQNDRDDGHGEVIRLTAEEIKEFGIEVAEARPGRLEVYKNLPGDIVLNADRLVHVVPRVSGIVREVRKTLGDYVYKGEVMAVLESRELADAKASFLGARERVALAEANFIREESLWKKKISSEQEYLEAKQALAEARIELRSAEQKLHALGFSEESLARIPEKPDVSYTRYEIVAPFDGTIIEKHITLGEVLKDDAEAYVIADLRSVWVDISVYQKDLPFIRKGQEVIVSAGHGLPEARGRISYVGPLVGEETRTALARVVLPNPEDTWRPGMFITARVMVDAPEVDVVIPRTALQNIDDETYVFVETGDGFIPRAVEIGRSNTGSVEVVSGLLPGQRYVAKGAFTLKAQLLKAAFGDGNGH